MLIATQLLICAVVVSVLVYSFKSVSSHNNTVLQTVALKDTEECMREMVNNTIIRIESKRKTSLEETNKLIDGIAKILLASEEESINSNIVTISHDLHQMEYGAPIQILIRNTRSQKVRLFSDGTVVELSAKADIEGMKTRAETSKLHKSILVGAFAIDLFAAERDLDEVAKKHIYEEIHSAAYDENEYIWVNEIVNFSGGDNYAIRRIHPNLKETEGSYLSTNQQDGKGNRPYQTELNRIKEKGEVLQTYYFKNRSNDEITQKISYAKLYEPFQWVVATGKPLNDIFLYTNELQTNDTGVVNKTMIVCLFFMLTIFIIGISIIIVVHKKYRKRVDLYVKTETELDPLTGAFNRKVGESILTEQVANLCNHECALPMVMMLDIDNFKMVNDSYGHEIGDIVLKKVVQVILANKKETDYLFRWGGEEFILFCHEVEKNHHRMLGKKLLRCISEVEFKNNENRFRISISIGSSYVSPEDTHYGQALKRADIALYHSKDTGKNKYTNFEELSFES